MIDVSPSTPNRLLLLGTIPSAQPGTPHLYDVEGEQIVVTRQEGMWCAFVNQCPHAGAPLADGVSPEGSVTCGRHGWTFDLLTGQRTGNWSGTGTFSLNLRTVIERDGMLYLQQTESAPIPIGTTYLVRYGIPGWVAKFRGPEEPAVSLRDPVLIKTTRGLETGELLAIQRREKLPDSLGDLLRPLTSDEQQHVQSLRQRSAELLEQTARLAAERHLPQQFLDAEILWDGQTAIIYYLGPHGLELADLAEEVTAGTTLQIQFQPLIEPEVGGGCGCGSGGCHS